MAAFESTLVDAGPLVALLVAEDMHHDWARRTWEQLAAPLFTCEAVLSEAQFLVARFGGNPRAVLEFVRREALRIDFVVQNDVSRLLELQQAYRSLPMSLADARLVRMAEQSPRCRVMTTDSHFRIYRRNGRQLIPVLMPDQV